MRYATLFLAVVLAACSSPSGEPEGEVDESVNVFETPQTAAEFVFESLAAGDYQQASEGVDGRRLAVLTSIESDSGQVFLQSADNGVDEQTSTNFWSQFVAAMDQFGQGPQPVETTVIRQFAIADDRFASVAVRVGDKSIPGAFVFRLSGGEWKLDALASFGGPFISPIRSWLRTIPSADLDPVRTELGTFQSSFLALVEIQNMDDESGIIVTESVKELLAELGASPR